jgi:hypothetical protein
VRWSVLVLLAACGSKKEPPAPTPVPGTELPPQEPGDDEPAPAAQPDFPAGTRSLELAKTVAVRLEPADDSKRIGTIAIDTRVGWQRTQKGKGCTKPWIEVKPHGWICGDNAAPSTKAPFGREVPMLDRGEIVPGDYGRITGPNASTYTFEKKAEPPKKKFGQKETPKKKTGPVTSPSEVADAPVDPTKGPKLVEDQPILGTLTVRIYEEATFGGKQYLRISQKEKEYVLKSQVNRLQPSLYMGARLGDDTGWAVPFAFVYPRNNWQQAWTYSLPPNRSANRQVPVRMPVPILETFNGKDGKAQAYRIGPDEWIGVGDVRVFQPAPPPPLLKKAERWIDVDLDAQILVAFEGDMAVYSTLISSGIKDHNTTTGLYRVWLKESEADMKNLKAEDPYSVATVPWTQFFYPEEDLALHTAYWHDQFGKTRSHGCVNLAPRDARWLYYWSDPQMSPGWTSVTGVLEMPGSVVRVRSAADPNPEWKGYAKKVLEARQQNAPAK